MAAPIRCASRARFSFAGLQRCAYKIPFHSATQLCGAKGRNSRSLPNGTSSQRQTNRAGVRKRLRFRAKSASFSSDICKRPAEQRAAKQASRISSASAAPSARHLAFDEGQIHAPYACSGFPRRQFSGFEVCLPLVTLTNPSSIFRSRTVPPTPRSDRDRSLCRRSRTQHPSGERLGESVETLIEHRHLLPESSSRIYMARPVANIAALLPV